MSQLNVTLRSTATEQRYQTDIAAGKTRPLEIMPSIKQWEHWRLVENDYPYDAFFKTHHMLVIKRGGVAERTDLNDTERAELEQILKQFVYPGYHFWFENCPRRRTAPGIYHLHLIVYKDRRDEVLL